MMQVWFRGCSATTILRKQGSSHPQNQQLSSALKLHLQQWGCKPSELNQQGWLPVPSLPSQV